MKKFTKMLALCLALAMVFGMSVSAKENPSVVANKIAEDLKESLENGKYDRDVLYVVGEYEITEPGTYWLNEADGSSLPHPSKGGYVLFHYNKDTGEFLEEVAVHYDSTAKRYYAIIESCSPFILVVVDDTTKPGLPPVEGTAPTTTTTATGAPVSPKTGETLLVAGMMAVLCLAGVVVCAKKARCNG